MNNLPNHLTKRKFASLICRVNWNFFPLIIWKILWQALQTQNVLFFWLPEICCLQPPPSSIWDFSSSFHTSSYFMFINSMKSQCAQYLLTEYCLVRYSFWDLWIKLRHLLLVKHFPNQQLRYWIAVQLSELVIFRYWKPSPQLTLQRLRPFACFETSKPLKFKDSF